MRSVRRNTWSLILLLAVTLSILFIAESCNDESRLYEKNKSATASDAEPEKAVTDWFFRQRAYPVGRPDVQANRRAADFRRSVQQNVRRDAHEWEFRGPENTGGRITDLEMPPGSMNTIYVATASGGIFKSTDRAFSWRPVFDEALSLAVGDIKIAPSDSDIIYAGTGEPNAGGGSLAYDGSGVYRSDDAGENWVRLPMDIGGSIGKVEVDHFNPDVCYVAAMGELFANGPDRGLYKTEDGGQSWEKVLFVNDSTGIIDLAMHPQDPDILIAASWERIRRPHRRSYGGAGSGLYRTTDGGENWDELTDGLPSAPEDKGRIGISYAPTDPDYVYAIYADQRGYLEGIYRSRNGGDSWTKLNHDGFLNVSYMWWFGKIFVSPANPGIVYATGLNMHRSDDGGFRWEETFEGSHVDPHALYIHPDDPEFVLLGNDGGLYISEDGGDSYEFIDNLPITQFYTCEMDYSEPERLYGGSQDNGTNRTLSGATDDWERIYGGDGFIVQVDPADNNTVYAEFQYGNLARSDDGGQTFNTILNGISASDRRNWKAPYILDPNNPSTLYYGSHRIYRSENRGDNWTPISLDLTKGPPAGNLAYGTISAISVSPLDGEVIYAGTDDGQVQVTRNGGDSWELVSGALPDRWVTSVTADPFSESTVYVTLSGYRWNSNISHIYKSTNYGQSWISIAGNLPDVPVNELIVNPNSGHLYIATDIGVFYSVDEGLQWEIAGEALPNVVVPDISYHDREGILLAATFGRGMYSLQVDGGSTPSEDPVPEQKAIQLYPNPASDYIKVKITGEFDAPASIKIISENGGTILERSLQNMPEGIIELDISQLARGNYFLSFHSSSGKLLQSELFQKI